MYEGGGDGSGLVYVMYFLIVVLIAMGCYDHVQTYGKEITKRIVDGCVFALFGGLIAAMLYFA